MPVEPMPPVVVGLDGSAASLAALDLAAEEAAGRVTPLEIVYVSTVDSLARGGDVLGTALGRVRADHPCLAVRGVFVLGDPAAVLARHAEGSCLAVVGHRGAGGSRVVGPVAVQVAHASPVPVIICRPFDREHADARPRAVLLGVDGLPCTEAAAGFAFEEAALRGAAVEAHHLWWQPPAAGIACCFPEAFYAGGAEADHARREARAMLAGMLDTWSAKYPEVEVRQVRDPGDDGVAGLLAASHDAQLVVAGGHAHPGVAHLLADAVISRLIQESGCSVAITQGD